MARNDNLKPVGATGLRTTWGGVGDDFLNEWRGSQKVKRVQEMLYNSPIIAAVQMSIEMPILDIDWTFTSDEGEKDKRLTLLNEATESMSHSLNDHILEALLHPFYGWHLFSLNYKRINGRILWDEFLPLGHDTIEKWTTENGRVTGVKQYGYIYPDPIPNERLLHYKFRPNRNSPEGRSILRPCWIPYYYTKNIQHLEAIAIERNLNGLPVIEPPVGADMAEGGTDYEIAHKVVRNVRNDEQAGVVLPPPSGEGEHNRWHFTLMSGGESGKVVDTDLVISRYEKRMLMTALSQFLMLGMDNVGALATFEGSSNFFTLAVNATADNIASTITKQAIPRLLELNGQDAKGIQLEHSPAGDIDITTVSDFLQKTGALLTWTDQDENWLRQLARMPQRVEDDTAETIEDGMEDEEEMGQRNGRAAVSRSFFLPANGRVPHAEIYNTQEQNGHLTAVP